MAETARIEKGTDVKSHILDTAQRLIAARGFSAVGLNEILLEAKVPKGSFYHYFASKDAFGADLLEHYFKKYLVELDGMLGDERIAARDRLGTYWNY